MKRKIFAVLLALWMVMTILPLTARGAEGYAISVEVTGGDRGYVELQCDRAGAGAVVWLLVAPEEGYLAEVEGSSTAGAVRMSYGGLGMYAITMPDGDVEIRVRFAPAGGALYPITGTVSDPDSGTLVIRRSEAREGEWVAVETAPRTGCVLKQLQAVGTDGLPVKGGYADTLDGVLIYEYCMPDAGVVLWAEFVRESRPRGGVLWRARWMPRQELRFVGLYL